MNVRTIQSLLYVCKNDGENSITKRKRMWKNELVSRMNSPISTRFVTPIENFRPACILRPRFFFFFFHTTLFRFVALARFAEQDLLFKG